MNQKILQQIYDYLPKEPLSIDDTFLFLTPDTLWEGEDNGQSFMVVAEDHWPYDGGLFLAVTAEGAVYIGDLSDNSLMGYCAAGFPQFMEILAAYQEVLKTHQSPDVWDDAGQKRCEEEEAALRQMISKIDPTAIQDSEMYWSVRAEEIGAGF